MVEDKETKNSRVLNKFIEYCRSHTEERFWQAFRTWSDFDFILGYKGSHEDLVAHCKSKDIDEDGDFFRGSHIKNEQ